MLQRRRVAIATMTSIAGLIAILISIVLSVILGYADIKLQAIWDALFHFDPANREHLVIQTIRLPRVFAAGIVGTCFAVAGAMMQGMTRNPLADSSLLGINAGAGLVLALSFAYLTHVSYNFILLLSIFGATVGAALIYGIGVAGKNNSSSLRLVLAGAAVTALFNGLNEGLSLYFGIGQKLSFWYASGVSRVTWSQIVYVTPWFVAGLACALMLSRSVTILSIGEDNARSLGLKIGQLKLVIALVVLVLAGISVALVGGVGFVGLIVPHLVRKLVGHDYRLVIPCSAVLGALLVILADLFARTMNPPFEIPLSAVTAALGVPFFLYLVRKGGRME